MWVNVKTATGTHRSNKNPRYVNIDGEWLNNQQFADNLNNYYVSIGGDTQLNMPELPTTANDNTVPDKVSI